MSEVRGFRIFIIVLVQKIYLLIRFIENFEEM